MKLDMHDTPMMMLTVASLISLAMIFVSGMDGPSWWPLLFLAEMALSWVLLGHRAKQLETLETVKEE